MGILTINDCGTAHEDQLLEIYNGLIDKEKLVTGKEPNSLEKSNIELQVAEAYQSILTICNDGGQISKALELLKERVPTMSINEISKIAVDVVSQVSNVRVTNENDIKDVAAFGIAQAVDNGLTDNKFENSIENVQRAYAAGSEAEREIISRAHSENATDHDKDMYVALSQTDVIDFYNTMGLRFEELDEHDRGFVIKNIRTFIADGKQVEANIFMQQMGITQDIVDDSKWDIYNFEDNTMSLEDAELSRRIAAFSNSTVSFVKYYDKLPESKKKETFEKLMSMYESSPEKIDFGLESLSEIARSYTSGMETPEMQHLLKTFVRDIEDENQMFEVDQYMAVRMVALVNKLNKTNSDMARRILEAFNKRAEKVNYSTFDFEKICKFTKVDINTLYIKEEKPQAGKDAYERVVRHVEKGIIQTKMVANRQPTKLRGPKGNDIDINNSTSKKVETLEKVLEGVYQRDGMRGVMRCMQTQCVDTKINPVQKKCWLDAYSMFLNSYRDKTIEENQRNEDTEIITETIKNMMLERGNNIRPGSSLYKFVQIANETIKGRGKENSPVLSTDEIDVKTVIENVSRERGNLFKTTKDVTDNQDGSEPEL